MCNKEMLLSVSHFGTRYIGQTCLIIALRPGFRSVLGKSYKNLKLFLKNSSGHLKNHCTDTKLVCTHFNAFFMLKPNMVMKV